MLKALFVLRYLRFCPDFLGMLKKRLYKRVMVKFKIHDFTDWIANNYNTHILPNISRSIGCENIALQKLCRK